MKIQLEIVSLQLLKCYFENVGDTVIKNCKKQRSQYSSLWNTHNNLLERRRFTTSPHTLFSLMKIGLEPSNHLHPERSHMMLFNLVVHRVESLTETKEQ